MNGKSQMLDHIFTKVFIGMNLYDFIALDDLHTVSSGDVQSLNKDLSERAISEIPAEHKDRVRDYIVSVLNMGSVDPIFVPQLERLLGELQKIN